jgi:hypothetical protein
MLSMAFCYISGCHNMWRKTNAIICLVRNVAAR